MRYVTVEQVCQAHEILLARYGGNAGGGHRGSRYEGVDAAVMAVENSYYVDVYDLAAAYAVYIVQGHVFLDGNKRAASAAMLDFLDLNDALTAITPEDVIEMMVEMQRRSESGVAAGDLIRWVSSRLSPRHR